MKAMAIFSVLAGLTVVIYLVATNGAAGIEAAIANAGWGIVAVIALHLPQVAFSSQAWRAVVSSPRRPSRAAFFGLRIIREAVNSLLPVAQIGGDFVATRLLSVGRMPLSVAGASITVDRSLELLTQVLFTLLGVGLLLADPTGMRLPRLVLVSIVAALSIFAVIFIQVQRSGVFRLLESGLAGLARKWRWKGLESLAGLHVAIVELHKSPRRLILGGCYHLISWVLGGIEVLAALRVLGVAAGPRQAMIIESLGQACRAVGFVVPGGLGVQEGGMILICGALGIGPQAAIEASLLKRIRELALGLPGLAAWYWIEGPRLASATARLPRETKS